MDGCSSRRPNSWAAVKIWREGFTDARLRTSADPYRSRRNDTESIEHIVTSPGQYARYDLCFGSWRQSGQTNEHYTAVYSSQAKNELAEVLV